ncbi:MAG: zinc ribbon domain-containing protein [Verrucomicrobiaceae bacterium]|nr:zinc ribbon domain-containing protein [Verrucomicrobiaceae bacterium]
MNTISVLCQQCGAPLEIADESVRFVTCAHCNTPLEIVREATQTHSRILEQIQATTTESAKTLKVIELQNDLERLDRDWEKRRLIVPENEKSGCDFVGLFWLAGVFGIAVGLPMIVSSLYHGVHEGVVQGVVILVVGVAAAVMLRRRANFGDDDDNHLIAAENDHQIQRQALLHRIEEAKRAL